MQTTERSSDRAHQDLITTKNSGEQKKTTEQNLTENRQFQRNQRKKKKSQKVNFLRKKKSVYFLFIDCIQK